MITIVGAGFAGVEAAWACAQRGVPVVLYEMRPVKMTPAHTTEWFAELVCSNSFKSKLPTSPAGQLKAEMLALGSVVLETAMEHEVPGGEALAVDREKFARALTAKIEGHPLITVRREEFTPEMAEEVLGVGREGLGGEANALILATGPLTSPELADWLARQTGREHLYFYDAVSPTVDAASLDRSVVFAQSRYDKGAGDDYLNCPFEKSHYEAFVEALVSAERAPVHAFEAGGKRDLPAVASSKVSESTSSPQVPDTEFTSTPQPPPPPASSNSASLRSTPVQKEGESAPVHEEGESEFLEKLKYFAGCTPIEIIAEGGLHSLRFGNFKPVGLTDPRTDRRPYAALQLRPENKEKTLYSLVACQTRLKWGEQKRVFRMVPGLENAEFVRFGVIHRNTFIEAPRVLTPWLEMRERPGLFVSGQLTGVEGYVESAAMGIYVGLAVARRALGLETETPPRACAYGSLVSHLQDDTPREFAPMNINWGLFPDPEPNPRDKGQRRALKLAAANEAFGSWVAGLS
jgi:methylenetetrahydrofolate--tRNA-(uracil-5-)-methyltransferase